MKERFDYGQNPDKTQGGELISSYECDYMTAKHFTKFFGTIGEVSASYTWNAGMVVVNPATPNLPQTGDNASIVGFAMVVVAMVAAAVVTFKKVRA